jgi:hypothetical protein
MSIFLAELIVMVVDLGFSELQHVRQGIEYWLKPRDPVGTDYKCSHEKDYQDR